MQPTKLLYLEDFAVLTSQAKVLEVPTENDKTTLILDETIFYPQGGGQPYDTGTITGPLGKFKVEEVRFIDGLVKHIGNIENGSIQTGETVTCEVDKARRELHSRIHSAGHIIDKAVYELQLPWIPGKGYHFPEGPYIEYAGSLEGLDKEKLKVDIENLCTKYIEENKTTSLLFMDKDKMQEVCHYVPESLPQGKPARVVMLGDFGVPCGGTHVSHLAEIQGITIRKIKSAGSNIRVSYDVTRDE